MKDGVCPKCAAREVYQHLPDPRNPSESITLNDSFFSKGAMPEKYLCLSCGYLEYYLAIDDDIRETVRENWRRVSAK